MPSRQLEQETPEGAEQTIETATPNLVVLCEGQADCHFYGAVAAAVRSHTPSLPEARFVDGGGKYAFPALICKLRQRGEDMRVVADFDVLSAETPLREIVEALGGAWTACHPFWREVHRAVRAHHPALKGAVERRRKVAIRSQVVSKTYGTRRPLERTRSSSWTLAKRWGRHVVPEDVTAPYHALVSSLTASGLFTVEVGELERFVPAVGHHGSRWAGKVLGRYDAATAPELEDARHFVAHFLGYSASG